MSAPATFVYLASPGSVVPPRPKVVAYCMVYDTANAVWVPLGTDQITPTDGNASNITTGTLSGARMALANTTANGAMSTAAQSFAGVKTFTANLVITSRFSANGGVGTAGQALLSGGAGANAYWGSGSGDNQPGLTVAANVLTWNAGNVDIFTDYTDANNYHGFRITEYNNGTNIQVLGLLNGSADKRQMQLQNGQVGQTLAIEAQTDIHGGGLTVAETLVAKSTLFCNGALTLNSTANVVGDAVFHGKLYANEDDGKLGVLFLTRLSAQGVLSVKDSSAVARVGIDGDVGIILTSATAPSAAAATTARIYCDTSGGKVRVMALFPSGVAQQIAIEP